MTIFACLIVLAFWIGFWFWFLTRKDSRTSPDGRKAIGSPLTGNGDGAFYRKQDPDKDSADVLSRIRSEGF